MVNNIPVNNIALTMEKFVRRPLVTLAISSHTAAALSSHDPSARPTIPRAWTRWKKASAARRQCFVYNTSKERTREENTNISSQSRSCVGKYLLKCTFISEYLFKCVQLYAVEMSEANRFSMREILSVEHHCFSVAWARMWAFSRLAR